MTVGAECLSNTKSFKNKMTHLSSYKKFLSGSEMRVWSHTGSLQVPVRGVYRPYRCVPSRLAMLSQLPVSP